MSRSVCKKCGSLATRDPVFRKAGIPAYGLKYEKEHLDLTCSCGYVWAEPCDDDEEEIARTAKLFDDVSPVRRGLRDRWLTYRSDSEGK